MRGAPFYDLGPAPSSPVSDTTSTTRPTPPAADKPAWARGLPSHGTLVYVRDLGTATIVAIVGTYMLVRALRDPSAAVRAIRSKAGV